MLKYPHPPWWQGAGKRKVKDDDKPNSQVVEEGHIHVELKVDLVEANGNNNVEHMKEIKSAPTAESEWKAARDEYRRRRKTGMSRQLINKFVHFWTETQALKQVTQVDQSNITDSRSYCYEID